MFAYKAGRIDTERLIELGLLMLENIVICKLDQ